MKPGARWRGVVSLAAMAAGCFAGATSGPLGPSVRSPHAPPAERRVLVTLAPGSEAIWRAVAREITSLHGARLLASWHMASLGEQCLVLEAPERANRSDLAQRIAHHPRVTGVAVVGRFRSLASGADPYRHLQSAATRLNLEGAHRWASGQGVTVAVVDTGLDVEHPDLAERVTRANDFVGRGGFTADAHGTAVAGVLAARAGNGVGIVGVAPRASVWALKACWPEPPASRGAVCDGYTLSQALDAAIVGEADVINLSLAGDRDPLIERLVREALRRGAVVVAAAEGDPASFPASIPGVLAVYGWMGPGPVRADAPAVPAEALSAPGVDILTTVPRGGYDFFSGSSLAAAQASGVAALVLEVRPDASPAEVAALLFDSAALDTPTGGGARVLDACASVARARGRAVCGGDS